MSDPKDPSQDQTDKKADSAPGESHQEPDQEPTKVVDPEPEPTATEVPETPAEQSSFAKPAPAKPSSGAKSNIALWAVVLLLLILVGGLTGAAYKGWQMYQQVETALAEGQTTRSQQINDLRGVREALTATEQTQTQLQQELGAVKQNTAGAVSAQEQKLSNMAERLDAQQERINALSNTSREDWQLAEAEYLLRVANQRVLLERNPHNAIALLEAADSIVRQVAAGMGDPELFAIRQTLGRELTALKLVDQIDKEGTYVKLQALADSVEQLPRMNPHHLSEEGEDELMALDDLPEHMPWYAKVWEVIKDSAGVLDQYIKVGNSEGPVEPLLDQNQALMVAANTRLYIQQAQLALLKEEQQVYQQSLQQAQALVENHFLKSPERRQYLEQLQQFESLDIAPKLPDISQSLKLLHSFVEKLHKLESRADT